MSRRKHRHDFLDSRLSQTSLDLFRLARKMWDGGCATNAPEFLEVSRGIDRALGIRPWQPALTDFMTCVMDAATYPSHANFQMVKELHRRLSEAVAR